MINNIKLRVGSWEGAAPHEKLELVVSLREERESNLHYLRRNNSCSIKKDK